MTGSTDASMRAALAVPDGLIPPDPRGRAGSRARGSAEFRDEVDEVICA
jgi:hypothetical protein